MSIVSSATLTLLGTGETVAFETTEEECHVVGSLLKSLLRELPEPIFTYELYDRVIAAPGTYPPL